MKLQRRLHRQELHTMGWDASITYVDTINEPVEVSVEDKEMLRPLFPKVRVKFDTEKDDYGNALRRVIWTPVPVHTKKRVFKKIVVDREGVEVNRLEWIDEESCKQLPLGNAPLINIV